MDDRMETVVAGVALKNPVITASGTFGSGREYGELIDLNCLGAVTVKGVSCEPWKGNPIPRIAETQSGMLNSIGLQNPGVEHFIEHDLPFLRQHDTKIIVNICGHTLAQYCAVAERLGGGLRLWMSIFIPRSVLIRESASAPPDTAALAISVMSVTSGESFTASGCPV